MVEQNIGIAYGASDEWHQTFVDGRKGSPVDVLIDATGVLLDTASADPWGWKALRAAMGSAFRLPVLRDRVERDLSGRGLRRDRVLATVADDTRAVAFRVHDLTGRAGGIVGPG